MKAGDYNFFLLNFGKGFPGFEYPVLVHNFGSCVVSFDASLHKGKRQERNVLGWNLAVTCKLACNQESYPTSVSQQQGQVPPPPVLSLVFLGSAGCSRINLSGCVRLFSPNHDHNSGLAARGQD